MSIKSQHVTKNLWVAVATAAAAILPVAQASVASADETANTNTNTSWRAKSVEDVKAVLLKAGTEYTVQSGDTLSTIAAATDETVDQIAKANGLSNIHFITVGETLKLHTADDQTVADEPATTATAAEDVVADEAAATTDEPAVVAMDAASQPAVAAPTYNTAGNSYPAGQCTWFVKNALSWVGNNWGNAAGWGASAAAAGRVVDGTPAAGAVAVFAPGQAGAGALGHVAVVDSVNSDGTITISEGNYAGMAYHVRTISAAGWQYIH